MSADHDPGKLAPLWPFKLLYAMHSCCQMLLLRFITTYFVHIGLDTTSIGYLTALRPFASFVGEFLIASVVDYTHCFRSTLLIFNSVGATLFLCMPLATGFNQIAVIYGTSMLGVSWMGLRDARVLASLESYGRAAEFGTVRKFAAFGFGASGLLAGQLQDWLGKYALFGTFASLEVALMIVVLFILPLEPPAEQSRKAGPRGSLLQALQRADVLLLFFNLFAYGVAASAVETFLFVYLLRDFRGSSDTLNGCTLLVMTTSEIPVFQYMDRLLKYGYMPVHVACHWVFALRCLLYSALPTSLPWLVLGVEPLHGITFAAMWASAVDFARSKAPAGTAARFQALVNGIYFQASFGVGNLIWGSLMDNIGYRSSYRYDALFVLSWSCLWGLLALRLSTKESKSHATQNLLESGN